MSFAGKGGVTTHRASQGTCCLPENAGRTAVVVYSTQTPARMLATQRNTNRNRYTWKIPPPQRGAALFCFLLGLLYLSHSAAAFEIGPSFLIRGAGVAMGQQDLASRWTFPLPLGTWELAAGQECSGQKFSSAYCALCVLSGGSWAPCFWGRQGHLPCFPHVGNLFSPAPFSWCFSSLRLGPWSNLSFLYVL